MTNLVNVYHYGEYDLVALQDDPTMFFKRMWAINPSPQGIEIGSIEVPIDIEPIVPGTFEGPIGYHARYTVDSPRLADTLRRVLSSPKTTSKLVTPPSMGDITALSQADEFIKRVRE